jgi:deazaflavin-dependent oxidoreductase (nitroreductase family)
VKVPRFIWRVFKLGPRLAYTAGLGPVIGSFVLLLTTYGRKSGLPRVTPLVYEEGDGVILVAAARGPTSDWLFNIRANPRVRVRVGRRRFDGIAEVATDPERMADYLQRQYSRRPKAFGAILRAEGMSIPPGREELVRFAPRRPMVSIRPLSPAG